MKKFYFAMLACWIAGLEVGIVSEHYHWSNWTHSFAALIAAGLMLAVAIRLEKKS